MIKHLNKHHNINFTVDQENVGSLLFLVVKICRKKICGKNGKFVTSVYRKPTFSGVFYKLRKFHPNVEKRGLLQTLFHRSFSICCGFKTFHL